MWSLARKLELDDPSALDGDLYGGQWTLSRTCYRLRALQWIELSAVTTTDQLLGAFVIGNGAALVGADQ